jgi:hypothetical protein
MPSPELATLERLDHPQEALSRMIEDMLYR